MENDASGATSTPRATVEASRARAAVCGARMIN